MKKLILFKVFFLITTLSFSQKNETILVKAGTSLLDYFSFSERYLYPEFTKGKAFMKSGVYSERNFNYNFLSGEIDYLQDSDTLSISNKKDIKFVKILEDSFYYNRGYIMLIRNNFPKIGIKDYVEFKGVEKKDPYGTSSSGSSTTSYNTLPTDVNYFKLKANQDMVFERSKTYYISATDNDFILFNKKNVIQLFPDKKAKIKTFIKSNKISFRDDKDLIKLADYIGTL